MLADADVIGDETPSKYIRLSRCGLKLLIDPVSDGQCPVLRPHYAGVPQVADSARTVSFVMPPFAIRSMARTMRPGSR